MVEIPLSQGLAALVDDEDADLVLSQGKWHVMRTGDLVYARRNIRRADGVKTSLLMHTLLTGYAKTDHENGNGLDNRRANLRPATDAENARNSRMQRGNVAGFKGVTWDPVNERYRARIRVDGRDHWLGRHATAEGAAKVYDAAALRFFGDFARLNFPEVAARG